MQEKLLKIEEVAMLVDRSYVTINLWYRWKKENPDDPRAKLLPDFIQSAPRQTRYWRYSDIEKLIQFKNTVIVGMGGFMGDTTQKYLRKTKEPGYEKNKKPRRRIRLHSRKRNKEKY